MLCDITEAMDDESFIPDTAISLNPLVGYPSDIRPGVGWTTNSNDKRIITLVVGPNLDAGGTISLDQHVNVKSYTVFIQNPRARTQIKVFASGSFLHSIHTIISKQGFY